MKSKLVALSITRANGTVVSSILPQEDANGVITAYSALCQEGRWRFYVCDYIPLSAGTVTRA